MASDVSAALRRLVAERARLRCEYCLLPQAFARRSGRRESAYWPSTSRPVPEGAEEEKGRESKVPEDVPEDQVLRFRHATEALGARAARFGRRNVSRGTPAARYRHGNVSSGAPSAHFGRGHAGQVPPGGKGKQVCPSKEQTLAATSIPRIVIPAKAGIQKLVPPKNRPSNIRPVPPPSFSPSRE